MGRKYSGDVIKGSYRQKQLDLLHGLILAAVSLQLAAAALLLWNRYREMAHILLGMVILSVLYIPVALLDSREEMRNKSTILAAAVISAALGIGLGFLASGVIWLISGMLYFAVVSLYFIFRKRLRV